MSRGWMRSFWTPEGAMNTFSLGFQRVSHGDGYGEEVELTLRGWRCLRLCQ